MYDEFCLETRAFGWMEGLPTAMDWFEEILVFNYPTNPARGTKPSNRNIT